MNEPETIGFEVRELSLLIARHIEKMSDGGHIRGPQGFALGYLVNNRDKEIYQKDLEERLSIRKPTASNLVDRMIKNGFLTTAPSQKDKRLKQLIVTEKAIQTTIEIEKHIEEVENILKQDVSEEEITQFFATMQKFKNNIQQ
ncbi:MarR family winged helix-turn-helix transcriptional regulator [Enterococcus raffinosus]|uniref:MarR family winged helix-turn-helix transcriptional regulator n=1 Tax=Enterococcus raffinosus TaxID=71452 RepID=A0AAW8T9E3_9ENTE|nr:MarR family winged helix-turn-helix transcriptional regulator [Enterococcus raffinosus]MDT2523792.1 MarR family winged helix-turn-helix transcriptional regulator [Enterococcus raffinosus]MDT2529453.1 MarR family winged helix-turn-helix transcriptional regulator [Enterococcus raffinosus]MDT2534680.1 MarR family winged helix-turn-helix transcriptional regulator [Enterococcus raffinosus]MDT2544929.1 MarR family winged helix-turn-helix transcriptional regulator [Enterococcus raffinosus]MDT25559